VVKNAADVDMTGRIARPQWHETMKGKNEMSNFVKMFGEYVRFIPTGEILRLKSYNLQSQMLEIELPTGGSTIARLHEIDRITREEELEIRRSEKGLNPDAE
jgi:hypothetical protein